jgi:hypothetical protein
MRTIFLSERAEIEGMKPTHMIRLEKALDKAGRCFLRISAGR